MLYYSRILCSYIVCTVALVFIRLGFGMARGGSVKKQEETQTLAANADDPNFPSKITLPLQDSSTTTNNILRHSNSSDNKDIQDSGKKRQPARKSESLNNGNKWLCNSCRFLNVASTDRCVICTRWKPRLPRQVPVFEKAWTFTCVLYNELKAML